MRIKSQLPQVAMCDDAIPPLSVIDIDHVPMYWRSPTQDTSRSPDTAQHHPPTTAAKSAAQHRSHHWVVPSGASDATVSRVRARTVRCGDADQYLLHGTAVRTAPSPAPLDPQKEWALFMAKERSTITAKRVFTWGGRMKHAAPEFNPERCAAVGGCLQTTFHLGPQAVDYHRPCGIGVTCDTQQSCRHVL
jgi:hypothetical protein